MKIIQATDYGSRKVVRVIMNGNDPEAVHADGSAHEGRAINPEAVVRVRNYWAEFGRQPTSWEWCPACRYNWKEPSYDQYSRPIPAGGFTWNGPELLVELNEWGNPVHDDQRVVSTRLKVWDELYEEIETRLGQPVNVDTAPREPAPVLVEEL